MQSCLIAFYLAGLLSACQSLNPAIALTTKFINTVFTVSSLGVDSISGNHLLLLNPREATIPLWFYPRWQIQIFQALSFPGGANSGRPALPMQGTQGQGPISGSCQTLAAPWTVAFQEPLSWNFPSKNAGWVAISFSQGIFRTQG